MASDWFIHGALIFGLVVVIPMGLAVSDRLQGRSHIPKQVVVLTGTIAAASFFFDEGTLAAGLCIPWLAATVVLGLEKLGNLRTIVARSMYLIPHGYLVFGAGWLALSRYGGRPMEFPDVIVELTAVHFHFAGFVAPVVISMTRNRQPRGERILLVALWLSLVASPLTAIGFVYSATIGAVGAITFTAALVLWAAVMIRSVLSHVEPRARLPLGVASGSVLITMTLAVVYSVGVAAGESWIDISTMARTHGVLNAFGFAFCGAGGWLIATRGGPSAAA